jgi:hypothetical protein
MDAARTIELLTQASEVKGTVLKLSGANGIVYNMRNTMYGFEVVYPSGYDESSSSHSQVKIKDNQSGEVMFIDCDAIETISLIPELVTFTFPSPSFVVYQGDTFTVYVEFSMRVINFPIESIICTNSRPINDSIISNDGGAGYKFSFDVIAEQYSNDNTIGINVDQRLFKFQIADSSAYKNKLQLQSNNGQITNPQLIIYSDMFQIID